MSDASAHVGITIDAKDKSGPAFQSAAKSTEMLKSRFAGLGAVVGKAPGQFSQAAIAMTAMGGATGQAGGKVAAATGQIAQLAALMAVGGPLGVAMAAITIAFSIYSRAVDGAAEKVKKLQEAEKKRIAQISESFFSEQQKLAEEDEKIRQKQMADIAEQIRRENLLNETLKKIHEEEMQRKAEARQAEEEQLRQESEAYFSRIQHEQDLADFKQRIADSEKAYADAVTKERVEKAEEIASAITAVSGHLTEIVKADSEEQRRAAISAALDEAQAKIVAKAASGAASAFEAYAGIPVAGPIIGAVAAAVVGAAILAFRSQVKLAQGGLVTGGVPGKDSVPAMLMPGERVVSAGRVQEQAMLGGGGGTNVSISLQTLDPSSVDEGTLDKLAVNLARRVNRRLGPRGLV